MFVEKVALYVYDRKTWTAKCVNHLMKKIVTAMGLVLASAAAILPAGKAFSQNYWVVETNNNKTSIVKIYNESHQLVNEKKVERKIDINKRRERRMLNRLVKQSDAGPLWSKR